MQYASNTKPDAGFRTESDVFEEYLAFEWFAIAVIESISDMRSHRPNDIISVFVVVLISFTCSAVAASSAAA